MVKTQGRHGEVAAEIHSAVPDRFSVGQKLFALPRDSEERRTLEIEALWPHKSFLVFKFVGVDSLSDAENLVGCELQVPRSERAKLEPGWNFVSDLAGCVVCDRGREIGRIQEVQFGAGEAPLLIVRDGTNRLLEIPFAKAYLDSVDIAAKKLSMSLPEGLLEVNAPLTVEEKLQESKARKPKR